MDNSLPDPSRVLYGEFTDALHDGVRYSVSLTESALTVQRICASPCRAKVAFDLSDCVGCRAHGCGGGGGGGGGERPGDADVGAYFTAYFYPFRRRWMSAGVARQRVERRFRVVAVQEDPVANLREAERWARAIRDASARRAPRRAGEENFITHKGRRL